MEAHTDKMSSQELLNAINLYVQNQGLTPIYKTVEELNQKMKLNKIQLQDKLQRAYDYFIFKKKGRGMAPDINTYGTILIKYSHKDNNNKGTKIIIDYDDSDDEIEHDLLVVVSASWIPLSIFQHFVFEIL